MPKTEDRHLLKIKLLSKCCSVTVHNNLHLAFERISTWFCHSFRGPLFKIIACVSDSDQLEDWETDDRNTGSVWIHTTACERIKSHRMWCRKIITVWGVTLADTKQSHSLDTACVSWCVLFLFSHSNYRFITVHHLTIEKSCLKVKMLIFWWTYCDWSHSSVIVTAISFIFLSYNNF